MVLVAAVWLIHRNAEVIGATLTTIGWPVALVAFALGAAGTLAVGAVWLALLQGLTGGHVDGPDAVGTFYLTQLGKYVPGAVWPILAQMAAARRWGCARSAVLAANLLMLAQLAVSGLLLALVTLPWAVDGPVWLRWSVVLAPVLALLLHPRFIPAVLHRWPSLRRRLGQEVATDAADFKRAVLASLLTWAFWGIQLWVLLRAAGAEGASLPAVAIGAAALSWVVGLVVVVAPAGAGAREAVLVAICAPLVGGGPALAVALACRVLLTLTDVVLAAIGGLLLGSTGRDRSATPVEQ